MNFKLFSRSLMVFSFLCFFSICYSQEIAFPNALSLQRNNTDYYLSISPVLFSGTHINGIGASAEAGIRINHLFGSFLLGGDIGLFVYPSMYATYYGIPGQSIQLQTGGKIGLNFGKQNIDIQNPWIIIPPCTNSINYLLSYYLSSDKTNQAYGVIEYLLSLNNHLFQLRLDNDDCYIGIPEDMYRTAKGKISLYHYNEKDLIGFSFGYNLWTGNHFEGIDMSNLDNFWNYVSGRDKSYTLMGYGTEYSHGIAFFTLIYNYLHFSFGYDSESIRDFLQNGAHYLSNYAHVPLVDRPDKLFFQISFSNSEYAY